MDRAARAGDDSVQHLGRRRQHHPALHRRRSLRTSPRSPSVNERGQGLRLLRPPPIVAKECQLRSRLEIPGKIITSRYVLNVDEKRSIKNNGCALTESSLTRFDLCLLLCESTRHAYVWSISFSQYHNDLRVRNIRYI